MSKEKRTLKQLLSLLPKRICPECESTNLKTIKGEGGIVWWNCNRCDTLMALGRWK